jgi:hypothetical protein
VRVADLEMAADKTPVAGFASLDIGLERFSVQDMLLHVASVAWPIPSSGWNAPPTAGSTGTATWRR